jgi:dTDP-4-dehydrorhamnose 3,5-epimerase
MMQMTLLEVPGAALIETERKGDARGSFARWFCQNELAGLLQDAVIRQINHSFTRERGTIRGMHFQHPPAAEKKIVRCLAGAILDVIVDLRCTSPTFMAWRGFELSAENDRALLIPEGCAHGFQTLTDDVQLLYLHTAVYDPPLEDGLRYDDPRLNIAWPLPPTQVSQRDLRHPLLADDFNGIHL